MSAKTAIQYFRDENITVGINAGNSLDAVRNWGAGAPIAEETAWSNPALNQAYFNGIKTLGFDIVRIPVSWIGHVSNTAPNYTVNSDWLRRVAQVVNMARDAGLKAIINVHHDGNHNDQPGWLNINTANTAMGDRFERLWVQIADYFQNYGDFLMFQAFNEIHDGQWGKSGTQAQYNTINNWNQRFTNAVRNSGGNNPNRYLLYYGYNVTHLIGTGGSDATRFQLPTDPTPNRRIVGFHYYDPFNFAHDGAVDTWDTQTNRNNINTAFGNFKTRFIDNNIPVIIGETGPVRRTSDNAAARQNRLLYIDYMFGKARENEIVPIFWENGGNNDFGLINRTNGTANNDVAQTVIERMMSATKTNVPVTVTSVTVTPNPASVTKGGTRQFSAQVNGTGVPSQTVTWSLVGSPAGASISTAGLLTVTPSATVATITVRAASTVSGYTSIFGTSTVTVTEQATGFTLDDLEHGTDVNYLEGSWYYMVTSDNAPAANLTPLETATAAQHNAIITNAGPANTHGPMSFVPMPNNTATGNLTSGQVRTASGNYVAALRFVNIASHVTAPAPDNWGRFAGVGMGTELSSAPNVGIGSEFNTVEEISFDMWAPNNMRVIFKVQTTENAGANGNSYKNVVVGNGNWQTHTVRLTSSQNRAPLASGAIPNADGAAIPGVGGVLNLCAPSGGIAGDLCQEPYHGSHFTFNRANVTALMWQVNAYGDFNNTLAASNTVLVDNIRFDNFTSSTTSRTNIAPAVVTIGGTYTFTGSAQTPAPANVSVVLGGTTLVNGTDYTYVASNNVNAGTATVTVTGIGSYTGTVTQTFTIAKASAPAITWPAASAITYGAALSTSTLTGGSTTFGSFAWTTGSTVPTVTNSGYSVTFTPNAATLLNYNIAATLTNTVPITVNRAAGTFVTTPALSTTYTPTLTLANLTLPSGYTWVTPSTSLNAGDGQTFLAAYTNPNGNFLSANGNVTVNVARAAGTFVTTSALNTTYTPTLTLANVTLPEGYEWVEPSTPLFAGNGQSFTAAYTNPNGNYLSADGNITVNVAKASLGTFTPPVLAATYGGLLSDVELPDGWEWDNDDPAVTVGNAGEQTHEASLTAFDADNYEAGDWTGVSFTVMVAKADIDMSGITFADKTVDRDGTTYSIFISGELPNGVSVQYDGNFRSAAGVYTVTAAFTLTQALAANYNVPEPMTATLTIANTNSILSNRPGHQPDINAEAPATALSGKFTAGPNPVDRSSGTVDFFWQGSQIKSSTLNIFDASGNLINKVRIAEKSEGTSSGRREVGSWNLKNSRGRPVAEGTYLVKGVINVDGNKEKVSLILGVR
jgi:hypothetical protein